LPQTTTKVVGVEKEFKKAKRRHRQQLFAISKKKLLLLAITSFVISTILYYYRTDFLWFHHRPLQPPSHISIHGKHKSYTKVPQSSRKTYYIHDKNPFRPVVVRAFRTQGWRPAGSYKQAQLVWDKRCNNTRFGTLQKYQRYSYYPNWVVWDSKDYFLEGMQQYAKRTKQDMYMIPETYQLGKAESRDLFLRRLTEGTKKGMHMPWVLKVPTVNNGKGITMLPPNSAELNGLMEELSSVEEDDKDKSERRVVQAYICHELTWFLKRQAPKFDLRFYWMVASIDPLIVLYHDGYVRVGNAAYDESNWASTTRHLTTHTYLSTEDKGTMDELELLLNQHVQKNPQLPYLVRKNPMEHVRNQCRQAIAHTVKAFLSRTFGHGNNKFTAEGAYGFHGADFILTQDLHVWYIEAQAGPGMEEEFDFRVDMHRDLVRSMIGVVEEIQMKVEEHPLRNVFPLKHLGGWDVVYAGTDGGMKWSYEYEEYTKYLQANPKTSGCQTTTKKKKNVNSK